MIGEISKVSLWKRFSAALCDFVLLAIVAVGMALLLSWAMDYNGQLDTLTDHYNAYAAEYGIDLEITEADFNALSEEEQAVYAEADAAIAADPEVNGVYQMIFYMSIAIISLSLLVAVVLVELLLPLILGNGQTAGKKVFGVAVMRTGGFKVTPPVMFIRAILGKFTIEIMVPVMLVLMIAFGSLGFVGLVVLLGILILQVVVYATTPRTRSLIHDLLSDTVTVDMASQRIYESEAELLASIKRAHAEETDRSPY